MRMSELHSRGILWLLFLRRLIAEFAGGTSVV
jgi:hypothetical protein